MIMTSSNKLLRAALRYTCLVCNKIHLTELLPMKEVVARLEAEGFRTTSRSSVPHPEICSCIIPERISYVSIAPSRGTYGLTGAYEVELVFEGPYTKSLFEPPVVNGQSSTYTVVLNDPVEYTPYVRVGVTDPIGDTEF